MTRSRSKRLQISLLQTIRHIPKPTDAANLRHPVRNHVWYHALANSLCHSQALRYSLEATQVRVVEIVPPAVKTNLGGSHDFGEECDVFCAAVMKRVAAGELEVPSTLNP